MIDVQEAAHLEGDAENGKYRDLHLVVREGASPSSYETVKQHDGGVHNPLIELHGSASLHNPRNDHATLITTYFGEHALMSRPMTF
jgi:hypothetical protein